MTPATSERFLVKFDLDHDGGISQAEFLKFYAAWKASGLATMEAFVDAYVAAESGTVELRVRVPPGVAPGGVFYAPFEGSRVAVRRPADAPPGAEVTIRFPRPEKRRNPNAVRVLVPPNVPIGGHFFFEHGGRRVRVTRPGSWYDVRVGAVNGTGQTGEVIKVRRTHGEFRAFRGGRAATVAPPADNREEEDQAEEALPAGFADAYRQFREMQERQFQAFLALVASGDPGARAGRLGRAGRPNRPPRAHHQRT